MSPRSHPREYVKLVSAPVAASGCSNDGLILNWNGTQWSQVANPAGQGAALEGVDALGANDVWAINLLGTVTEQWNGTQWTAVPPASALPAGFRAPAVPGPAAACPA